MNQSQKSKSKFFIYSWPVWGRGEGGGGLGSTQALSLTAFSQFFWPLPWGHLKTLCQLLVLILGLTCTNNPFSVAIVTDPCTSPHINPTSPGGRVRYVQCIPQYLSEFPTKLNRPNFGRIHSDGCLQDPFPENAMKTMMIPAKSRTWKRSIVGWSQRWSYSMRKANSVDAFNQELISFRHWHSM